MAGIFFERKMYSFLGLLLLGSQALTLCVVFVAWLLNRKGRADAPPRHTA